MGQVASLYKILFRVWLMIEPPLRSCLGIPISDQIAQRCGNCSVIVTEKHLDGRGPLGLAMTAVKICATVIFYCPVFASETWVYTTMIRIISG